MTLTLRSASTTTATTKGSALSHAEMDANWIHLAQSSGVEFLQSGTGATTGTAQEELRRIWYPEQFGALGDGAADDASAWSSLLTAVGSSNFEIRGKPGATYLIGASGINISSKTNGRIYANGAKIKLNAASSLTVGTMGSTAIKMDSCIRVDFEGWEIDGNNVNSNPIGLTGCTECGVIRNVVTAAHNLGGIVAINNTRNNYLFNTVRDGYASGVARGMWIGNSPVGEVENEPLIQGNRVYNLMATGIGATYIGGVISNNRSITTAGSGIVFSSVTGREAKRSIVSNNLCRDNTFHGIQSDAASSTSSFIDVVGNICEENDGSGIYAVNINDSVFSSNICRNNVAYGIEVNAAKRLVISGNLCEDDRAGGSRTQINGIRLTSSTASGIDDVMVVGNHCYNHTERGINFETSGSGTMNGLLAVGNFCLDSTYGLVFVEASAGQITEATAVGNHCTGNGTTDLYTNPADIVLVGNRYSSQNTAIYTFATTDATPSVKGRTVFKTNNGSGTTITAFDDGVAGQEITVIIGDANTTIDFTGTTLKGNGGGDWSPTTNDSMQCVYDGTNWYCNISDNTA